MKKLKNLFFVAIVAIAVWAAPLTVMADTADGATTVTILHTNDMHGRFVASNTAIGIDTIAAIYAATPNAVLVDAGDTFHGMPFVNFGEGYNALTLMNMAGYRIMTPGNHDFNFGVNRLQELAAMADFTVLAANIHRGNTLVFDPYYIIEVDGVTIGFFGLAYPYTPVVTHPDHVAGLTFGDPVEAASQTAAALREQVDVIVAVAHLGVDGSAYSLQVAQAVPEIDIIIDGHSHTHLENGQLVNGVLIAQAGAHAQFLGRIDIVVEDGEVTSINASTITQEYALENYEPLAEITAAIETMNAELDELLGAVVGYTPVTFYGDSPEHRATLRSQEVPIGNLISDSMRWATGAELALLNSGGIRYHIHAGEITKNDIIEVLPFFNYAVVVEITAAQLWEALENGVSNMPGNGRFPQVSGFSFTFDEYAEEGSRVLSVTVDGEELSPTDTNTTFSLAINDFKAVGGDGYTVFTDLPRLGEFGTQDQILIDYMEFADLAAIAVEGRIVNMAGAAGAAVEAETTEEHVDDYEPADYTPEVEDEYEAVDYEPVSEPVEDVPVTPVPVAAVPGTGTVVNCWYLNVREAGSPQAAILGVLRVGTVVNILETNNWNWHRIETADVSGWIYGGFVELN